MKRYFAGTSADITERERAGNQVALDILREGIVLLENRDFLPIQPGKKLALFGYGARNSVYGGLGSASIHIREGISVEQGLEREGFAVTTKDYLDRYGLQMLEQERAYYGGIRERCGERILDGVLIMYSEPFVPSAQLRISQRDADGSDTDTAVFVISRCSGEGADRKPVAGDYELSADEIANLEFLERTYTNLIVILNTCGVIDTKRIRALGNLRALVFAGLGAAQTGSGIAEILSGKVSPSGKLASTWAQNYLDYPSAASYAGVDGELDDELYREGIYVGYRWFDAFRVKPAYCFGYGLSYTQFSLLPAGFARDGERVRLSVRVTNTGHTHAGKQVVQLYVRQPRGALRKAVKVLVGYEKTQLLAPSEAQTLTISVAMRELASYDAQRASWVLEQGDYVFLVGGSAEDCQPVGIATLAEGIVTEVCRAVCPPDAPIDELTPEPPDAPAHEGLPVVRFEPSDMLTLRHSYGTADNETPAEFASERPIQLDQVAAGAHTLDELAGNLTVPEMARLLVGNVPDDAGEATRASVFAAGTTISRAVLGDVTENMSPGCTETTVSLLESRGIPKLNVADGNSGLRLAPRFQTDADGNLATSPLFSIGNVDKFALDILEAEGGGAHYWQYPTAFPMATLTAQTWNRELLERCGRIIGEEADALGVDIWMSPSMNIHRNPLCGRNFEYYSEDPLVTGSCATAALAGFARCKHASPCIKHFACNNQEDNRGGTNAHISEQALREIYLKGYEMAVKAMHPRCLMTSLNLVNGVHMANQYDLLTTVLREEWGFDGLVMCDWGATVSDPSDARKYGCSSVPGCIQAGNDLIMPGTRGDIDGLLDAVERGALSVQDLRRSAKRMLRLMLAQLRP